MAAQPPAVSRPAPVAMLKASQMLGAAAFACIAKYMPVYYSGIGMDRNVIGILSFCGMGTTFLGQLFWSAVIDWLGEFKSVLVATQVAGTLTLLFYTLPVVQNNLFLVFLTCMVNTFLCSTGGSIIDAMCMKVLAQWKDQAQLVTATPRTLRNSEVTYGDCRLYSAIGWGGMSLIMGWLIDTFGLSAMFAGFAVIQSANVIIVVTFMPPPDAKKPDEGKDDKGIFELLSSFSVFWFFMNLFLYGVSMCLIENFLFIYLVQEFDGVTNFLLGFSTTIMCVFEIPVFLWVGPWLENQAAGSQKAITIVLVVCQMITAVRCCLYALMPRDMAWLVVVIGALQGVSFAAMWTASMEYAKRLSSPSTLAKMTSLTAGVYYSISMGVGSLMWGAIVETPAKGGIGFRPSFNLDAIGMVIWAIVWQLGLICCAKKVNGVAPEPLTED